MLSTLIQRVIPVNFTAGDLSAQLQAFLGTINLMQLVPITLKQLQGLPSTLSPHSLAALYRDLPDFTYDCFPTALCLYFGLVITIALIFRLHCSAKASKGDGPRQSRSPVAGDSPASGKGDGPLQSRSPVAADSPASGYGNGELSGTQLPGTGIVPGTGLRKTIPYRIRCDRTFLNRYGGMIDHASSAQFAEDLQVEEALTASLLQANTSKAAPSSSIPKRIWWFSKSPKSLCAICFETKREHRMFRNPTCTHSFCIKCTSRNISAKIQENVKTVKCPEPACKAALDYTYCRKVISRDIIVKWDECLCKSMIPESQRVYCPFNDCSAMLVKDEDEVIKRIACPACHRYVCADCRVPYHSEFTCGEFRKLSEKTKGREELMLKELAKKKSWRQCPQCKYYVEKTQGCLHITCRCKYEFCYRCGSMWSKYHGSCGP